MLLEAGLLAVAATKAFGTQFKKTVKEAREAADKEAKELKSNLVGAVSSVLKTDTSASPVPSQDGSAEVASEVPNEQKQAEPIVEEIKTLPVKDYYSKQIDPDLEPLTDFNVKIVNLKGLSEKTVYYFSRKNDIEWKEPGINAKLRTDPRFFDRSVSTVEALVNALGYELGAGEEDTFIYFVGADEEYLKLKEFCEQSYSTIKTFKVN